MSSSAQEEGIPSGDRHLQTLTREQLQQRIQQYNSKRERFDVAPTKKQLLSPFTVFCLVLNRTIGSGIFAQPVNILRLTGSAGVAIVIWIAAGLIILCIVASWMELALTIPLHYIFRDGSWQRVSAPRNGGDKNYLEYTYKRPRNLMKCVFGIAFIVWANLAGNALQFGVYMQRAIDPTCDENNSECFNKGYPVAWGIFVLTLCSLLNIASRKYSMVINNSFAVAKICFLTIITFLGIGYGASHGDGCSSISWKSPNPSDAGNVGDISAALFFAMFPYMGYEQPFYVVAEVSKPQRTFSKATFAAVFSVMVLYPLANIGYLCTTPYTGNADLPENMAIALIERVSSGSSRSPETHSAAVRTVSAILAVFIFGNLAAQTYTVSRVKQEIAKEGILPGSLLFATGNDTLFARWTSNKNKNRDHPDFKQTGHQGDTIPLETMNHPYRVGMRGTRPSPEAGVGAETEPAIRNLDGHHEQSPFAATFLHWTFEVGMLLAVGLPMSSSSQAYGGLTYVYSFVITGILGFLTTAGLVYLKTDSLLKPSRRKWSQKSTWKPYLDPLPSALASVALAFCLFAAFVPQKEGKNSGWPTWVGPTVGWASATLGVVWWCGLQFVQWAGRWELQTQRLPVVEIDEDGFAVQKAELVEHVHVPVEGN